MTEYALVLVLVGIVVIVILALFGEDVRNQYCQIVFSVQSDAPAPMCNNVPVSCQAISTSPVAARAVVTAPADDPVKHVEFSLDGTFKNREFFVTYCLFGGNGPCQTQYLSSGTHTVTAVVVTEGGLTGRCSIDINVP